MEARARHVEDGGSSGSFRSAAAVSTLLTLLADKKFEATADTGESEAILHMLREGTPKPLMFGVVASGGGEGQDGGSVGGTGDDTGRRARKAD